jgi:hypothetical protein
MDALEPGFRNRASGRRYQSGMEANTVQPWGRLQPFCGCSQKGVTSLMEALFGEHNERYCQNKAVASGAIAVAVQVEVSIELKRYCISKFVPK